MSPIERGERTCDRCAQRTADWATIDEAYICAECRSEIAAEEAEVAPCPNCAGAVDARATGSVTAAKLLDRIDAALPERAMTPEKVEAENERLLNRLKTLYADLAAPGPIDAERQRTLAELAHDAIGRDAEAPE